MHAWESEPNFLKFESNGYNCIIYRHLTLKHLCGYVGISQGHPLHGQEYNDVDIDLEVHGGLSFSSKRMWKNDTEKVETKKWWFGFDCGHCKDLSPGLQAMPYLSMEKMMANTIGDMGDGDIYRDVEYVKEECQRLAQQLKSLEKKEE